MQYENMKHDVFISYSTRNQDVANAICHVLEEADIRCWMAPRDIPVGSKYASVIKDAIVSSKVFVLIFSEFAAVSPWVESELNMAFSNRKTIIPYKVDEALVEDYDEFYVRLNNRHWIDSFPDFHERFNELLQVVSANVSVKSSSRPAVPMTPKPVERIWKVGDYYNVGGKEGVVFWVDATGKHGKIVSMDQAELQWCTKDEYNKGLTGIATDSSNGMNNLRSVMKIAGWKDKYPAFAWCADHGDGWYLSAIDELKELLLNGEVHAKVNGTLEQKRGAVMYSKGDRPGYWSSTEEDEWRAWGVPMSLGYTSTYYRDVSNSVRAVSAF